MENIYQCFVIVDSEGNITSAQQGVNIIATEPFDFAFLNKELIEIDVYKVVLSGMKASLVLK